MNGRNVDADTVGLDVFLLVFELVADKFDADCKVVLETIAADGSDLDTPEGRLLNPGHAIEMGWFLLDYARAVGDAAAAQDALVAIEWSLDRGWDPVHGGLYYFLDEQGYSPVQLEWSMKLWWPHCEALVACAKAYEYTRDRAWFERWVRVSDWTFGRFPDSAHGEWFGYLDRQGAVSQRDLRGHQEARKRK